MKDPTAVRVQIPAPLRSLAGGNEEVEVVAPDVASLIEALERQHQGFRDRLCDRSGSLRSYVRVFVNDEDVRHLENERTPLKAGDVVAIVPAIAGGTPPTR
jgi:molybdopterin synthase sulfur carrier subunit